MFRVEQALKGLVCALQAVVPKPRRKVLARQKEAIALDAFGSRIQVESGKPETFADGVGAQGHQLREPVD